MIQAAEIARQLALALEGGRLPAERRSFGRRLVAQLSRPPRIAVMGLAGSGKTALVNMLSGAPLMPSLTGVPVVELCHGPEPRLRLQMADGSLLQRDGVARASDVEPGAIRLVQSVPDARLRDWTFLELRLEARRPGQVRLMDWAARHADFILWCSEEFGAGEQALWSAMPDHVKDHAFLVLTHADRCMGAGDLAARIVALQPQVEEEFLGLYPVATLHAMAARAEAGPQALWALSGGRALWQRLRDQAELARSADLDQALMLLDRCKSPAPALPPDPALWPSMPELPPAARPAASTRTDAEALPAPCRAVLVRAIDRLGRCAADLERLGPGPDAIPRLLDDCTLATAELQDILSDRAAVSPALDRLRDDVIEAEQVLTLLRLERRDSVGIDAVTLLLQLKKELSAEAAE